MGVLGAQRLYYRWVFWNKKTIFSRSSVRLKQKSSTSLFGATIFHNHWLYKSPGLAEEHVPAFFMLWQIKDIFLFKLDRRTKMDIRLVLVCMLFKISLQTKLSMFMWGKYGLVIKSATMTVSTILVLVFLLWKIGKISSLACTLTL